VARTNPVCPGGKTGCRAGDWAVRRTGPELAGTPDRRLHGVSFHRPW